jgi:2-dehydropantoate 2-reductase
MLHRMALYRTSAKIDCDEGKPMEAEAMFGNPVPAAHGTAGTMPLVEALYRQLKLLGVRNLARGQRI